MQEHILNKIISKTPVALGNYQLDRMRHDGVAIDSFSDVGIPILNVKRHVYRTDLGIVSPRFVRYLANNPALYKGRIACDMGCGNGILSLIMALGGARKVVAMDINPHAVACTYENVLAYKLERKITVLQSNLFSSVSISEKTVFDAIVFDRPFLTGIPTLSDPLSYAIFSPMDLFTNFLTQLRSYVTEKAIVITGGPIAEFYRNYRELLACQARFEWEVVKRTSFHSRKFAIAKSRAWRCECEKP